MFFFSKSTNGFYHSDVNSTMPADVVQITKERHVALMLGQSNGQLITAGADGHPVLQDPPKMPVDVVWKYVRKMRDRLLTASDWTDTLSAKTRLGEATYQAWQAYRQALRDVTMQADPHSIVWPQQPT